MITVYGQFASSARRCLWVLEELGKDYEHVEYKQTGQEIKTPQFLKLNPAGKIPVITDGAFTISESLAINMYLARKYGLGQLWPENEQQQALVIQWSFFAVAEIESQALAILIQKFFTSDEERNTSIIATATTKLHAGLAPVDRLLSAQPHLLGQDFSLADLNLASICTMLIRCEVDLNDFPSFAEWLHMCVSRPAYAALMHKYS